MKPETEPNVIETHMQLMWWQAAKHFIIEVGLFSNALITIYVLN
jgi:hypothetical protein